MHFTVWNWLWLAGSHEVQVTFSKLQSAAQSSQKSQRECVKHLQIFCKTHSGACKTHKAESPCPAPLATSFFTMYEPCSDYFRKNMLQAFQGTSKHYRAKARVFSSALLRGFGAVNRTKMAMVACTAGLQHLSTTCAAHYYGSWQLLDTSWQKVAGASLLPKRRVKLVVKNATVVHK